MQTLINDENTGHLLPRDIAPNKSLLKSITAVNTMHAAELHSISSQNSNFDTVTSDQLPMRIWVMCFP